MHLLNLPSSDFIFQNKDGKEYIYDFLRKKYVFLTPEEWVRQNFIKLLVNHYKYPKSLIKIESGLKYNALRKRTDIVVYDREGNAYLIVECKSTSVNISQTTLEQITCYNHTLKAKYLVVTNGLKHFCCSVNHENKTYDFLKDLPML